ncbi:hypothetical protein LTR78_002878 [Recurvomyces mirabilis]|uniref:Rhodopsin domain-containing protein n=1 Tax=Recurvomyces mirabilis TaxID=574656 RepID=A0AAE0WSN8_9PEZI|nr:hypothetical protein LTR78_002878 [Recurvomyces mirabilis]KAK5159389.1 hypothetical protein LTS14_002531 [Recurvomyces mirabilis]
MNTNPVPDLNSPYCKANNVAEVLGVTGAFLGAALISVILRTYVRISMLKILGPDDYVMIMAALMAIGVFVCFVGETHWGIGRHNACLLPIDMLMQSEWEFAHGILVVTGVVLVKISIALFLLRLASRKSWKIFLWCAIVAASFKPALRADPATKCFSGKTYGFIGLFNSIINIITDVLFAVLPIPIIIKLQINLRAKITLMFILSLGFMACAAGIVKANLQTKFINQPDSMWHDSFNVWNMIELCLGILAASLPSLKPLFARFIETTRTALGISSASRSRSKQQQQQQPANSSPAYNSQQSDGRGGWKRRNDLHEFHEMMADVPRKDYDKSLMTTSLDAFVPEDQDANEIHHVVKPKRAYNVRISGGRLSPDRDRSYPSSHTLSRSESQERLREPWPAVYKSFDISRTTEFR